MPDQSQYVPVNTSLLLQTLVEAVHEQVEERRERRELIATPRALDEPPVPLAGDNDPALDRALRVSGYLARLVEVDEFEPARRPADWVEAMVAERLPDAEDREAAIAALCGELATAEPIGKPDPDDPGAMSWRVPGPGGHVRHFVARRASEGLLRDREEPIHGDPAELKRPWLYGFFVRTCEEALADAEAEEPAAS
jgi:hypothetical protein